VRHRSHFEWVDEDVPQKQKAAYAAFLLGDLF